ncbi:PCRF domain-containing protein, partial [Planktomarina temperata]|nr:PCRF domain-containing protein [Planktomarina temperata]
MRAEMVNVVAAIEKSLGLLAKRLDYDTAPYRLEEFNAMIEDPSLWDDQERAQKLMRDRQILVDAIATYEGIRQDLSDNLEMIELGAAEDDEEVVKDAEEALKALRTTAAEKELDALLDGEADSNDTFLEINSGAGGTESCDWALMLSRMYVRWAEKKGYTVELQSETAGEEAGIKSAAYKISG